MAESSSTSVDDVGAWLWWAATHPFALSSYVVSVLAALFHLPVLWPALVALWASVPKLFAFAGVLVTISPHIDGIPQTAAIGLLVVVGVGMLVRYGLRFARSYAARYQEASNNNP